MKPKIADNKTYYWEWDRDAYPYYIYIFSTQWRFNKWCLPVYTQMTFEKGNAICFLEKTSLNRSAKDIISRVQKSAGYFDGWKNFIFKTGKELHKFCDVIEKTKLENLSDKELARLFIRAAERYNSHTSGVGIIRNTNRYVQERLLDIFKSGETVATIFSTDEKSFFFKEHEELVKLAQKIKNKKIGKKEIDKLLEKHQKKYFYLAFNYYGKNVLEINYFQKRLKEILKNKKQMEDPYEKLKAEKNKRGKLIQELNPDSATKKLIDFGSTCTYFKDFIRGNLNRLHYCTYLLFEEAGRRMGKHWEEVAGFTAEEIRKLLVHETEFSRRDFIFVYSDKKGVHLISGKEAEKEIKKIKKNFIVSALQEFKGTPANTGKAKGKILIVRKPSDAEGKKNFIMASPMTTPDLMQAMKKSIAIITDEGGLTSHAAIVARELGKPCVIGTKIATKVLRDGDIVEVDADRGIVKILK